MKMFSFAVLICASLVACGGKNKSNTTTPEKTSTEMKDGSMGGATYGGKKPATPPPATPVDPCAGQ